MSTCPRCGFHHPDGGEYCVDCGAHLATGHVPGATAISIAEDEPDYPPGICPSCGDAVGERSSFCGACGRRLDRDGLGETLVPGQRPDDSQVELEVAGELGGVRWGKYELLERIGMGGMGVVHRARPADFPEELAQCAVKLLLPSASIDDDVRDLLLQELYMVRGFDNPHIVDVYEHLDEDGWVGIVMELLDGHTLQQHLAGAVDGSPFRPPPRLERLPVVADVAEQLADALDYIHDLPRELVHRDVKPSNVMLLGDRREDGGARWRVKLLDFGVAHLRRGSDETPRLQPGTAAFMAPELLRGKAIPAPESDRFAFGLVVYQMLTGRLPAHVPRPPSAFVPGLPEYVDEAVLACLGEAQERPATAGAVARVLRRAVEQLERLRSERDNRDRMLEYLGRTRQAAARSRVERQDRTRRREEAIGRVARGVAFSCMAVLLFLWIDVTGGDAVGAAEDGARWWQAIQDGWRLLVHVVMERAG